MIIQVTTLNITINFKENYVMKERIERHGIR